MLNSSITNIEHVRAIDNHDTVAQFLNQSSSSDFVSRAKGSSEVGARSFTELISATYFDEDPVADNGEIEIKSDKTIVLSLVFSLTA